MLITAREKIEEFFYEEKTKGIIIRVRARWHDGKRFARSNGLLVSLNTFSTWKNEIT